MTRRKSHYYAYLLHLWSVHTHGTHLWRASLENIATGERRGFADLEALFGYLFQSLEANDRPTTDKRKGGGQ